MATLSPPISPQQSRSDRPERPRPSTVMSYASTHSHRSSKSKEERKLELTETSKDKRRLEGKSDPTKALHEAQPAAAAHDDATVENIRAVQHKDTEGNFIADPDRSNPTRPRMERPLDTIRSFNAAAEGTSNRRSSYQRQSSYGPNGLDAQAKRASYYGNGSAPMTPMSPQRGGPPRPMNNGYYSRNSSHNFRPEQYQEDGPRVQHQRYQSQPYHNMHSGESPNSIHSHQPSYETMTSGSDEMSKSTNPSSQNSSFDQLHQMNMKRQNQDQNYEGNPYHGYDRNGGPMRNPYPPSAMPNGYGNHQYSGATDDYGMEVRPAQRAPIKLDSGPTADDAWNAGRVQKTRSPLEKEQKRSSWIKRTFSKRN